MCNLSYNNLAINKSYLKQSRTLFEKNSYFYWLFNYYLALCDIYFTIQQQSFSNSNL